MLNRILLLCILSMNYMFVHAIELAHKDASVIGYVENNTHTKRGKEFFKLFSQLWNKNALSSLANIQIEENILYGRNRQLLVKYDNAIVFQVGVSKKLLINREFMGDVMSIVANNIILKIKSSNKM